MSDTGKPLVVTAGEPAGIGPDLCLALADSAWADEIVVIADPDALAARASLLGARIKLREYEHGGSLEPGSLHVLPMPLTNPHALGTPDTRNAQSLLDGLQRAVHGCRAGEFAGLVTAPLQKSVINEAGIAFIGHTELLAEIAAAPTPVMLLVAGEFRVALASTHMPLSEVPRYLTTERIESVLRVLDDDLQEKFGIDAPRIVVCGLNPHAGEGGHLGTEDRDVIAPAVERCRADGLNVVGPLPADTAFTPTAGPADAIVAMYHDQGLPVLKYAGFGNAVNVTLGLPFIRTSVDHGTALDIAGTGRADTGSMLAAVELARRLAQ